MKITVSATVDEDGKELRGLGFTANEQTPWREVCQNLEWLRASILQELSKRLRP